MMKFHAEMIMFSLASKPRIPYEISSYNIRSDFNIPKTLLRKHTTIPKKTCLRKHIIIPKKNNIIPKTFSEKNPPRYNRVKQRRPQRVMPSLKENQMHFELETACGWFCIALVLVFVPMQGFTKKYIVVHETWPWMIPRVDGTRGIGEWMWFHC